jgi:F420-non-reducing hydrogenase iron-sulfur subunit
MISGIEFKPRIVGFLCNWCCYAGADLCGVSRYQYPPYIRVIRLMCSGRVDMAFVLRAFSNGSDGVFIGGCWPGECHYSTEGNYDALSMVHICRRLLKQIGIDPDRLRLEWVSASEGIRFAEVMNDFAFKLKKLGPIGINKDAKRKLDSAKRLIPYIKLIEREKLRVPERSAEAYKRYFASDEVNKLIHELILNRLEQIQIMALLQESPRSIGEISEALKLPPSEISKHLNNSTRQGLARFDQKRKRFVINHSEMM